MTPNALRLLFLSALIGAAPPLAALPEDRDQPIEIRADRVEIDDEAGTAVYLGAVQLDQGTLRVNAHRLTIFSENQSVTRIVAEGNDQPARYRQVPEPDMAPIQAHARTITYFAQDQRVELEGRAHLRQLEDTFAGEQISYDIRERRIAATGGPDEPVTMTIQPGRRDDRQAAPQPE